MTLGSPALIGQVYPLDLNFLGLPHTIASYLIPHAHGVVLIESGPGSTISALEERLKSFGYIPEQVTDVLLTHIHLDHAGAAGWLARKGAMIHVHPVGAPHLLDPEKLLNSARRIYGEQMDYLWGEFLAVPADRLAIVQDLEVLDIAGLRITALDTPGHAEHHHAYLYKNLCFSGDVGGVRMPASPHLRVPMPPPEFIPNKWLASTQRILETGVTMIAPTHFGIFKDAPAHLSALVNNLKEIIAWIEKVMPSDPSLEELNRQFIELTDQKSAADHVPSNLISAYEAANPSWMSSQGILRYWKKIRMAS